MLLLCVLVCFLISVSVSVDATFSFKGQLQSVTKDIELILKNNKFPEYAADVPHLYEDKFMLANVLTQSAHLSAGSVLMSIIPTVIFEKAIQWTNNNDSVRLQFTSKERCSYVRTESKLVEGSTARVEEVKGLFGTSTTTSKLVHTVTEHFWNFTISHELFVYRKAGGVEESVSVFKSIRSVEKLTSTNHTPYAAVKLHQPLIVDISWLVQRVRITSGSDVTQLRTPHFAIDRLDSKCLTPMRNRDIARSMEMQLSLSEWCASVRGHYLARDLAINGGNLNALDEAAAAIVHPVHPVMYMSDQDTNHSDSSADQSGRMLATTDVQALVAEEIAALRKQSSQVRAMFTPNGMADDASLLLTLRHLGLVSEAYRAGLDYIENLLRSQLVSAVGKEITPGDLKRYMNSFHMDQVLFSPRYPTAAFSYAVRRSPEHSPEGFISIEETVQHDGTSTTAPIRTITRVDNDAGAISMAIDAATSIRFEGRRFVHGWLHSEFSSAPTLTKMSPNGRPLKDIGLSIVATARQFSSFILILGRVAPNSQFIPEHSILLRDKDSVRIPLLLETIPNAKQFQDFISSLSPTQQGFAKAYRRMQLQHSLLGIVVVQVKPQLERVLGLHEDALTKEIQLTRDLTELLVDYQIPSDLLSYSQPAIGAGEGNSTAVSVVSSVGVVKGHVAAMKVLSTVLCVVLSPIGL